MNGPLTGRKPNKCVTNNKEYTMKKQGFTLIELMVVIVIMGILAAVAVPKLFGMIAKSKASEVGPAAGEYVKLQDAFIAENGDWMGSFTDIGYEMGNTTNFNYTSGIASKVSLATKTGAWVATSNSALNDCTKGAQWKLDLYLSSSGNGAAWETNADDGYSSGLAAACKALTPRFADLKRGIKKSS